MQGQEYGFGTYGGQPARYHGLRSESHYVTMRDGVDLAVEVVLPKDLLSRERIASEGQPAVTAARNRAHASHIDLPVVER